MALVNDVVSGNVGGLWVDEASDFLFVKELVDLVKGFVVGEKPTLWVDGASDFLFVEELVDLVKGFVVGEKPTLTVKLMSVTQEMSPLSLALTVR